MASLACSSCLSISFIQEIGAVVVLFLSSSMGRFIPAVLVAFSIVSYFLFVTFLSPLSIPAISAVKEHYPEKERIAQYVDDTGNTTRPTVEAPLYTRGRYIVDKNGHRFKLLSVNWYGASDIFYAPGGLEIRHRDEIAQSILALGFNSVRLPYADELVVLNPLVESEHLAANPDLIGLRALDVYAAVVSSLTAAGIAVIINNHITKARWCCDAQLCDLSWKNDHLGPLCAISQSEDDWIRNMETVMRPHIKDPLVVGIDLRNEVRGLRGQFMWPSWATASERAAERLHAMQEEWLIIVEGVSSANDLTGVRYRPVRLGVPNKLVYSAHVYGWSGWGQLNPFGWRKYTSFAKAVHKNWGYLLEENIAPVWVGEFGAPNRPSEPDLRYWRNLMRYLRETDADLGYWALNPRKPMNYENETYGLLKDDWESPVYDYRMYDLSRIMRSHYKVLPMDLVDDLKV